MVVGEDDWRLCVHLWLAKFYEIVSERGTFVISPFVFVETGDTPEKLKNSICRNLKSNVLKTSEFKAIYEQTGWALHKDDDNANAKLGAHSNQKYAKGVAIAMKKRLIGVGGGKIWPMQVVSMLILFFLSQMQKWLLSFVMVDL